MQVAVDTFRKWSNELLEKVTDKHAGNEKACVVFASFCAMRYLIDEKFFPGYITPNSKRRKHSKRNNFTFLHSKSPSSPTETNSLTSLSTQALRTISVREKLLIHYGSKYNSSGRGEIKKSTLIREHYSLVVKGGVNSLHEI